MLNDLKEKLKEKLNLVLTVLLILSFVLCGTVLYKTLSDGEGSLFGCRIYYILTGSMEPTYPVGSNVIVRAVDPETLKVGDVITYRSKEHAIYGEANTHRIKQILTEEDGKLYFVTQGDANTAKDPIHVSEDDIIGKVIFKFNLTGINLFLGFLRTPMGFVTVIVLPCCLVLWFITRDLKNAVEEMREEIRVMQEQELTGIPEETGGETTGGKNTEAPDDAALTEETAETVEGTETDSAAVVNEEPELTEEPTGNEDENSKDENTETDTEANTETDKEEKTEEENNEQK